MSVISRIALLAIFGIFCFGAGLYLGSVNLFSAPSNVFNDGNQGFVYQTCLSLAGAFDAFIPHGTQVDQAKTSELEQKTNYKMPQIFNMKSMSTYCDKYKK